MSPGTIAPSSKCEINFFRLHIATAVLISFAWFSICCCKLGNWTLIESENGEIFFFFSIWSVQRMFCCLLLHKYGTDYQKPIRVYKGKFWVWHQDSLLLNRDKLEIQCLSSHHNAQCFPREIIWKEPFLNWLFFTNACLKSFLYVSPFRSLVCSCSFKTFKSW